MKFISYQERRNKEKRLIRRYRVYHFGLFKIKKKVIPVVGDNNKIIIGGREITQEEKQLLDKFGKITIEGNKNTVELPNTDDLTCDIRIEGSGNSIFIGIREVSVNDPIKVFDSLCKIKIEGNNNRVNLTDIYNMQCKDCIIHGDYNKINVGKILRRAQLGISFDGNYNYRELEIEDSRFLGDCFFSVGGSNNRKIHVGKNCMFSLAIHFNTADHPVYDLKTNKRTNEDRDIIIGDHVWIGRDVWIFKGSVPSGCIVGTRSFVNKVFTQENCIIAGIPAKVVKENIRWEP